MERRWLDGWRSRNRYDGREQRAALRTWPSFAGCSGKELAIVDSSTFETCIEPGCALALEGQLPDQVVFVLVGCAEETAAGTTIGTVGPGGCIGGIATLGHTLQPTTVCARTRMVVRVATVPEYRGLVARVPSLHPRIDVFAGVSSQPSVATEVGQPRVATASTR